MSRLISMVMDAQNNCFVCKDSGRQSDLLLPKINTKISVFELFTKSHPMKTRLSIL